MYKIINKNIYLNRGDAISIVISNNSDTFKPGDYFKFYICKQGDYSDIIFSKQFDPISTESHEYTINLTKEDTKLEGPVQQSPRIYWYEVELNGDTTLVGYDDKGPKLLTLWPEAEEEGGE